MKKVYLDSQLYQNSNLHTLGQADYYEQTY